MAYARKKETAYKRDRDDFFPTTQDVLDAFIRDEGPNVPKEIWEPAAGDGAISKALQSIGREVISTDLVDRGFCGGGMDFLMELRLLAPAIITNAPFKLQANFMRKAIQLDADYISMFHQTSFLNSSSYDKITDIRPAARVYVLSWRPDYFGIGSPDQRCNFSWTV